VSDNRMTGVSQTTDLAFRVASRNPWLTLQPVFCLTGGGSGP
jgi:hypothetical protein